MFHTHAHSHKKLPAVYNEPANLNYKALHAIADQLAPGVRDAFLKALARLRDGVRLSNLEDAIERRAIGEAMALVGYDAFMEAATEAIDSAYALALARSAEKAIEFIPGLAAAGMRFDLVNPRSVAWISENSANLVRGISTDSRQSIRNILRRSFEDGIPPRQAARLIKQTIGLTQRQTTAVYNYRNQLTKQGYSQTEIDKRTARTADRYLRQRSETIARTETIRASSAGQQLAWEESVQRGLLRDEDIQKQWIVTPDDRLCPYCRPMAGQVVALDDDFTSPTGGTSAPYPPLHPNCRCSMGLVFADDAIILDQDPPGLTAAEARAEVERIKQETNNEIEKIRQQASETLKAWTNEPDGTQRSNDLARLYTELRDKEKNLSGSARSRQLDVLRVANPSKFKVDIKSRVDKDRRAKWEQGIAEFRSLVPAGLIDDKTLGIKATRSGRSYYDNSDSALYMSKQSGVRTVIHELGHGLEFNNQAVFKAATDYYNQRTAGENTQRLSTVTGIKSYGNSEVTKPDRFFNAYVGKWYEWDGEQKATEIVSMGLEYYWNDPAWLAENDPGLFDFIYNLTHGDL